MFEFSDKFFVSHRGGRSTHIAINAALNLARKYDFKTDDIEKVTVHLSPPMRYAHYMKPYKVGDYPTGDALFSYRYATATALYRKSVTAMNFAEKAIRDPEVQALIKKIELAPDLEKDDGAEMVVRLKDGRILSAYVKEATGEIPHPLSWDALTAKFVAQADFSKTVNSDNTEKIIKLVDKLENVDNIRKVIKLAVKQKSNSISLPGNI